MTRTPAHKPAGTAEGGQFTATARSEPSITLSPEQKSSAEMRETGKPQAERAALVASLRETQARIDALDINEAATALRRRYPTAATLEARTTGEDDVVWAELRDADGTLLTAGDTDDPEFFTELDQLDLVPDKYRVKTSPLRACTTDDDEPWLRRYDLDKMAALTADQITGAKK